MTINQIKTKIEESKGKKMHFKFNGTRNQIEEFYGIVEKTYNCIFTIRLSDNNSQIKSFCYSDILTDSLEIL